MYPGIILSEAMYVREIEAPPAAPIDKHKFKQQLDLHFHGLLREKNRVRLDEKYAWIHYWKKVPE